MSLPAKLVMLFSLSLFLFTGGFYEGHHLATQRAAAQEVKAEKEAAAKYQAQTEAYNQIENQLQVVKNAHIIVTQKITKLVDRLVTLPIYRNVCLDAAGVSAVNAALAGEVAPDSGVPADDVSATDAVK